MLQYKLDGNIVNGLEKRPAQHSRQVWPVSKQMICLNSFNRYQPRSHLFSVPVSSDSLLLEWKSWRQRTQFEWNLRNQMRLEFRSFLINSQINLPLQRCKCNLAHRLKLSEMTKKGKYKYSVQEIGATLCQLRLITYHNQDVLYPLRVLLRCF